jgi:membrane-bound inhibitor of C-type lysozyme
MIKTIQLFLCLFLLYFSSNAQNVSGKINTTESTNKADADKGDAGAGVVNVDNYTGTGSVSIPIYAYQTNGMDLGVSLHYSCKGLRVDEVSSPVGLGWSLSAEPEITRQPMGFEDEVTLRARSLGPVPDSMQGVSVPGSGASPYDDLDYDLFNVNIGGRSFSFVMDKTGNIQTYPKVNVQIKVLTYTTGANSVSGIIKGMGLSPTNNMLGFTIIDEYFNTFYFKPADIQQKKYKFEDIYILDNQGEYYVPQRWTVWRIVTASKEYVNYNHTTTNVDYQESQLEKVDGGVNTQIVSTTSTPYTVINDTVQITKENWKGVKQHLTSIEYPNAILITFDVSNDPTARCDCQGSFRLKGINVEALTTDTDTSRFRYRFDYSYYSTPVYNLAVKERADVIGSNCNFLTSTLTIPSGMNSDSAKAEYLAKGIRLRLDKIVRTKGATVEPFYEFKYNMDTVLPYRFNAAKDFYGFYNGNTVTPYVRPSLYYPTGNDVYYLSMPYHLDPVHGTSWGVNKGNSFRAGASLLKTIVTAGHGEIGLEYKWDYSLVNPDSAYGSFYPTGYYIDSNLEGQTVNDGVVVSKLTYQDNYHSQSTKTTFYTYNKGQRFERGGYTYYVEGHTYWNTKVLLNNFVNPTTNFSGSNHGFSEVIVKHAGIGGEELSNNKYYYTNLTYYDATGKLQSSMEKYTGGGYNMIMGDLKKFRMGLLYKNESYDPGGYLYSKVETEYDTLTYYTTPIWNYSRGLYNGTSSIHPYRQVDISMVRVKKAKTTRSVNDGGTKTLTTEYNYVVDDKNNVNRITWVNSKGETFKKFKKYNYNYLNQYGYVVALDTMDKRKSIAMISSEVWKYRSGGDSVLQSFAMNPPIYDTSAKVIRFPVDFVAEFSDPLTSSQVALTGSSATIDRAKMLNYKNYTSWGNSIKKAKENLRYDNRAHYLEVTSNDAQKNSSVIFDTYHGKAVASVEGAKYSDIAYVSFDGAYQPYTYPLMDYDKGNWLFDPYYLKRYTSLPNQTVVNGKYAFQLGASGLSNLNTRPLGGNDYMLTFWVNSIDSPTVSVKTTGSSTAITIKRQNVVGNWKLYSALFNAPAGYYVDVRNAGTNTMYIDEVRLHPVTTTMVSYVFDPLFGPTSTTDGSNYITRYEYDVFGRRVISRDMRGYILEKRETAFDDIDGVFQNPQPPHPNY